MTPDKPQLRSSALARRAALPAAERREAGRRLSVQLLAAPELAGARVVAAYVAVGSEPVTTDLLTGLRDRGVQVLLPLLRPDNDLDWAELTGVEELVTARHALLEPPGPGLGVDAVRSADAVLCPGLAVDGRGHRLGRGGGSYDRVLSRLTSSPAGRPVWTCVLLYDGERLDVVPADPHDQPVAAVATPSGITRLG